MFVLSRRSGVTCSEKGTVFPSGSVFTTWTSSRRLCVLRLHVKKIWGLWLTCCSLQVVLVGAGKASFPMASAVTQLLGDVICSGHVISKDGHLPRTVGHGGVQAVQTDLGSGVTLSEAAHPIPNEASVAGAAVIRQYDLRLHCCTAGCALLDCGFGLPPQGAWGVRRRHTCRVCSQRWCVSLAL